MPSTAAQWLMKQDGGIDSFENMLLDAGIPISALTEYPEWMRRAIANKLRDSFNEPYWDSIVEAFGADVSDYLQRGVRDGYSIRQMARDMAEMMEGGQYARNRAATIARTESGNALNGARREGMDELLREVGDGGNWGAAPMRPTWLSVLGTTTRDTHADLDGVPCDKDGMWELGGVRVPYPMHPSLPPGERCNCQCSIVLEFGLRDEEAQQLIADYQSRIRRRSVELQIKAKEEDGRWVTTSRGNRLFISDDGVARTGPGGEVIGERGQWGGGSEAGRTITGTGEKILRLKANERNEAAGRLVESWGGEDVDFSDGQNEILTALTGDSRQQVIALEKDGDIVGAVSLERLDTDNLGIMHLGSTGDVRGVGTELVRLSLVEATIRNRGIELDSTPNAVGFYKKLGFKVDPKETPSRVGGRYFVASSRQAKNILKMLSDKRRKSVFSKATHPDNDGRLEEHEAYPDWEALLNEHEEFARILQAPLTSRTNAQRLADRITAKLGVSAVRVVFEDGSSSIGDGRLADYLAADEGKATVTFFDEPNSKSVSVLVHELAHHTQQVLRGQDAHGAGHNKHFRLVAEALIGIERDDAGFSLNDWWKENDLKNESKE